MHIIVRKMEYFFFEKKKSVLLKNCLWNLFSEQFPLRGCLNPDSNGYYVTYVSQEGSNEEVIVESKTLRQLNPFQNILKLNYRNRDRAQYMLKKQVGQLIGFDLKRYNMMMSCEVNDFRWRMKVFANQLAQERRARL